MFTPQLTWNTPLFSLADRSIGSSDLIVIYCFLLAVMFKSQLNANADAVVPAVEWNRVVVILIPFSIYWLSILNNPQRV